MTRVKETIARHDKGYNCAQSVACTYADLVGLDEETMFKVTEGLGKGMGGTLATCGALSGACVQRIERTGYGQSADPLPGLHYERSPHCGRSAGPEGLRVCFKILYRFWVHLI